MPNLGSLIREGRFWVPQTPFSNRESNAEKSDDGFVLKAYEYYSVLGISNNISKVQGLCHLGYDPDRSVLLT
jgi:hypothetical protein